MTIAHSIVITRPIAQGLPLAQRLTQLGFVTELFPLQEIAPLPEAGQERRLFQAVLADLAHFALVSFVSPNAVHAVFQALDTLGLVWPAGVAIAVVGEGSRAALGEHGITDAVTRIYCPSGRADSEALLQTMDLAAFADRDVLIVRAETGRELFADALIAHNIRVTKVIAYQRLSPLTACLQSESYAQKLGKQLQELLTCQSVWLMSSSEALRTLTELTRQLAGEAGVVKLQQVILLVSHQRIAETAEKCQFKNIHLIGPGDANLLLALQSYL